MIRRLLPVALTLGIGLAVLAAVVRAAGPAATAAALRDARAGAVIAGLALTALAYGLRGARWAVTERRLRFLDALGLVVIGFMGNNLLPARRGELLRAQCAAQRTRVDGTTALAAVAAERILDALAVALCGAAAAVLAPVGAGARIALLVASAAVALPAAALVAGVRAHGRVRELLEAFHARFPGHLTRYARDRALYFLDALLPLGRARQLAIAAALTASIWAAEAAAYAAYARAAGLALPPAAVLGFLAAVNLASLFPLIPGGVGVAEAAATALLVATGAPAPAALAAALLQHGLQYALTSAVGIALVARGRFRDLSILGPARSSAPNPAAAPAALEVARARLDELAANEVLRPPVAQEVALSIVIPAYDEQARLPRTLLETLAWCSRQGLDAEIVVVDDGSRDGTLALGRLFEEQDRRVRVLACPHMGKGAAVRMGMLNARGARVLFMDADGATPLGEIPKLLAAIDRGGDVAVGSRVMQQPGEIRVETPLHRRLIGRTFAFAVNVLAVPGVADSQCGFKMFRREAIRPLFARQRMNGFAFDVEILYLARRLGLRVAEIPVNWNAVPGSKVNLVTDSMRMLRDVARVRWLHRTLE